MGIKTRTECLAAIIKSGSIEEVWDLANHALRAREAWGDDLASSVAAAKTWAGWVFPISASEAGAIATGYGCGSRGAAWKSKADIEAFGLAVSKAVACALLAPMPAAAEDGCLLGEPERLARWRSVREQRAVSAIC